jgi:hypothetical protein
MAGIEGQSFRWIAVATVAILVVSAGVVIYGSIESAVFSNIWWSTDGLWRLCAIATAFWASLFTLYWLDRKYLLSWLALGGVALVAAASSIGAVASALLVFFSGLALGNYILCRNRSGPSDSVDLVLQTATGLALLTWLFSLLALLPINNSILYALILVAPCLANWRNAMVATRSALAGALNDSPLVDFLLFGLIGNLVIVFLVVALLPEVGFDALGLHLAVAAWVQDFGFWHYDVTKHVLAVIPLAGDFMFTAAFMLGGETAARLTNVGALILLLVLTYASVREIASRRIALVAALSAASSPLALMESASLFIENPWALLLVGSLVAMLRYRDTLEDRYLYAAALTFGGAAATKLISLAAGPALGIILLFALLSHRRPLLWRPVGFAAAIGVLVAVPPYLIALVKTGNPVFPFFNAIFKSPLFSATKDFAGPFPGTFDPLLLYNFTFFSDRYLEGSPGSFGFSALALLPAAVLLAIAARSRRGIYLVVMIASFAVIVSAGAAYLRYMYPLVFVLALLIGDSLASLQSRSRQATATFAFVVLASIVANVLTLAAPWPQIRDFPFGAIVGTTARQDYVRVWAPTRRIVDYLNVTVGQNGTVAFLGNPAIAELQAKALMRAWYTAPFSLALARNQSVAGVQRTLAQFRVGYVVVDSTTPALQREAVDELRPPLFEFGDSAVYRLSDRMRFPEELLLDTAPSPASGHWHAYGAVTIDAARGAAKVTVNDLLFQVVAVAPNTEYLLSVIAQCDKNPASLRLQINWLDAAQQPLRPTLLVRPCSKMPIEERAVMLSPPTAAYAVVYAAGHGSEPVLIKSVSLRTP